MRRLPARSPASLFFALGAAFFGFALIDRAGALVTTFGQVLLICFLAWLVAFIVSPIVNRICAATGLGRGPVVGAVYAALAVGAAALIFVGATVGAAEASSLLGRLDEGIGRIGTSLAAVQATLGLDRRAVDLAAVFQSAAHAVGPQLAASLSFGPIAGVALAIFGAAILILILSVYMVIDAAVILAKLERIVPNRFAAELDLVNRSVSRSFGGFLRTQVILMAVQASLTVGIGAVFGLPYLFLCTAIGSLAMFIPFFGPPIALFPLVLVAAAFAPGAVLPVAVILALSQTILVNAIQPRLMKSSVGIHPIVVLVTLLVGSQVAGLWGALFSIPLAAVGAILVNYLINLRAVAESPDVDLDKLTAQMSTTEPDMPIEEIAALAADQAQDAPVAD